jgi:hypothetical protein
VIKISVTLANADRYKLIFIPTFFWLCTPYNPCNSNPQQPKRKPLKVRELTQIFLIFSLGEHGNPCNPRNSNVCRNETKTFEGTKKLVRFFIATVNPAGTKRP